MKLETGNLVVETEWGWAHVHGVDGNPSCKIPVNSANSPPCLPTSPLPTGFSGLELLWRMVLLTLHLHSVWAQV